MAVAHSENAVVQHQPSAHAALAPDVDLVPSVHNFHGLSPINDAELCAAADGPPAAWLLGAPSGAAAELCVGRQHWSPVGIALRRGYAAHAAQYPTHGIFVAGIAGLTGFHG